MKDTYYNYCLQGDLSKAVNYIKRQRKQSFDSAFCTKVINRFIDKRNSPVRTSDAFVKEIVKTYRNYYRDALLDQNNIKAYDKKLFKDLKGILDLFNEKSLGVKKWENLEQVLLKELKSRGYEALAGRVKPLRSLMIWVNQKDKVFNVKLPREKRKVKVVMLDKFIELGWLHYITFGKYYVGGWADKRKIFCVKRAWVLESDRFKVSYLAHEAQHMSDYHKFPKLESIDLEYRAKLVELILAKRPKILFDKFKKESKNDKKLPHCYSSFVLISEIINQSGAKSGGLELNSIKLKEIAQALFENNTTALKNKGAKKVKSLFR